MLSWHPLAAQRFFRQVVAWHFRRCADAPRRRRGVEVASVGSNSPPVDAREREETQDTNVTNTVFFEGIPALDRRGLVVLALLLLSAGLAGVRRLSG